MSYIFRGDPSGSLLPNATYFGYVTTSNRIILMTTVKYDNWSLKFDERTFTA